MPKGGNDVVPTCIIISPFLYCSDALSECGWTVFLHRRTTRIDRRQQQRARIVNERANEGIMSKFARLNVTTSFCIMQSLINWTRSCADNVTIHTHTLLCFVSVRKQRLHPHPHPGRRRRRRTRSAWVGRARTLLPFLLSLSRPDSQH